MLGVFTHRYLVFRIEKGEEPQKWRTAHVNGGHHKLDQGEESQITYTLGRPPTNPVRPGAVCVCVCVCVCICFRG